MGVNKVLLPSVQFFAPQIALAVGTNSFTEFSV
jgi:hypothetical protein